MLFSNHGPVDLLRVSLSVGDSNNNVSCSQSGNLGRKVEANWTDYDRPSSAPEMGKSEPSVLCTYLVKNARGCGNEPITNSVCRIESCDRPRGRDCDVSSMCDRKYVESAHRPLSILNNKSNNYRVHNSNYARVKVESVSPQTSEFVIGNSLDVMTSCPVRKSPVPNVRFKGHVIPQIPLNYSDDEECKSSVPAPSQPDPLIDSRCLTSNESVLNIEFDGTTVLCRVCGDKASGFHYGVHSCEGCKGFFRRSIQQKIQYRPCTKNQQCAILRINRNRCQYCRLKKCIAVGMSRDAVRFGRVPKREKARILAAMQQSTNSRSQEKAVAAELEDEQRLLNTVVTAHLDTCEFTRDKVEPLLQRARDDPEYTACPPTLACPLNPNPQPLTGQQELLQDFSKRFSPAIRGVVEFAKRIPGFALLPQDDQVTLLKAGVFEVLLVRLACMFNAQNNSMICLNGQVLRRESVHNSPNARFLMNSMFDFAERLNSLRLSDAEIGLFSSIVVIAPDRPGLRNVELIERMQNKLKMALQIVVNQNHSTMQTGNLYHELMKKIADLRTLNTLHSEKLLAFKMTEQQQQLQQQQQQQQQQQTQQQLWGIPIIEEENCSKSPAGSSSWSSSSDVTMDEVKSPLGSVSSTESMCSGEMNDYSHHNVTSQHAANAPLLAATLAGNICPHRHRANSGSTSGEDDKSTLLAIKSVNSSSNNGSSNNVNSSNNRTSFRKLDSPSDSGIESGTEKIDKLTNSAPTSVCSSPRSSLEDDHHHHHQQNHNHIVEDMPVLKRVLQAPPLYDTNSLMDEAYKPHKKFRALRNNACNGARDSAEAEPMIIVNGHHQNDNQNDHQSSQLHHHLTTSSSSSSLLSSTHSTLAKSLMEGPRMTPEQLKRTDIIHNFIMRSEAPSANFNVYNIPHQSRWGSSNNASVITTTNRGSNPASLSPSYNHLLSSASSLPCIEQSSVSQRHLHPSSAPISPSSTSPSLLRMTSPVASPTPSNVVELQVGIANSQQPLNLSKKTPPSSPRPPSANSHKVVTMEA